MPARRVAQDLEYLNLAVNNISKLQNLQRCESLKKLDLTINFVSKAGLLTVESLRANIHLEELYLLGNPCTDWHGYRQYVVAKLPQLKKLDGQAIKPSERIVAAQALPELEAGLLAELRAEGVDVEAAGAVEDDSLYDESGAAVEQVPETGYLDDKGELVRPWCAATRILEHRELEKVNKEAEDKKKEATSKPSLDSPAQKPPRHEGFPEIKEGERIYQKNEGRWDFSLEESPDGRSLVLEVAVGRFLDTSLIQTDLQPTHVRLLVKGKLLQLLLPCEVRPDAATAQRNTTTGQLVVTMPKEDPSQPIMDVAKLRPKQPGTTGTAPAAAAAGGRDAQPAAARAAANKAAAAGGAGGSIFNIVRTPGAAEGDFVIKEVRKAAVTAVAADDDGDDPPDL
ncbi:hypothetical protein GPECTOR_15g403 [Gonium pectorale]|uniref:U2A'/phosphoprotein 32 family A C-terminal domain-containing protein n=1 Tax=Gonium pectorale TaxID=33097 RepID=A0A150GLI7_GONPE|nr:hypothetical protein GPECTOR_15g403 [Gonium pectorale]|eukprot:KXZ50719.1 hypothetical protein GPECTOR_15g403 [Gonium pectorale]